MDQETLTRAIISNLIDRYLNEIASDPARSLRQLVDMAERLSDGPFQKIFFQMLQEMGRNKKSPYIKMFRRLVTTVDPERIRSFGIALGYNSWTGSSRNIRKIQTETGEFVPWILGFSRKNVPNRLPFSEVTRLFNEGKEKQICAGLLVYPGIFDEQAECFALFSKNPNSAFGLMVEPEAITDAFIREISEIYNLMLIINTQSPNWKQAALLLENNHCLYSVYRSYKNEEDAAEILSGAWIESLLDYHPLCAAAVPHADCPAALTEKINKYQYDKRISQKYPLIPIELAADCVLISQIISYRDELVWFEANGDIWVCRKTGRTPTGTNVYRRPLTEIFKGIV